MRMITIDISHMDDMEEIHVYLKRELDFPDYYGANLDALYDMLTDIGQETFVTLVLIEDENVQGYDYNKKIKQVFLDAARENIHIKLADSIH